MGVVLAPGVGAILGGWLTDSYGWSWIFYINVPVSIVGMFMVATFVHDPSYLRRGVKSVDWLGIGLLAVALTTMQVVLERGQENNWFESNWITLGTVFCLASAVALVLWELKSKEPVINLRMLRNMPLTIGSAMVIIFGVALFGTTFILPQFTQKLLGYPAFEAGLVLAPRALMLLLCMPIVGWLYGRVDARILVFIGLSVITYSYYELSHLSLEAAFWNLIPILLVMGVGMPFMFVTLSTVSLSTVARRDMTDASSIFTLARRVGGNIGYAFAATLVARGSQIHRTYLASHISVFNPNFMEYRRHILGLLKHAGAPASLADLSGNALIDSIVNRHATMLAYNDVSSTFGLLFLITVPLVFLLPGSRFNKQESRATAGH
jgi:DHA2 family multidrug resistance protein